jgi:signal peptidase I
MGRLFRVASLLAVLALAGAAWFFLAPREIGGSASYAVVYGTSMEPRLHRGDLVILRGRPSYGIGEVVGYRSDELHKNVLHRIVGRHGDRFVFKGDNNGFVDPEQPAASQLFGRQWVVVPGAGSALEKLRSPRYAAVAAALAVLVLAGAGPGTGIRRRRRSTPPELPEPCAASGPPQPHATRGSRWHAATIATGAVALVTTSIGGGLAVAAYRQPVDRTVEQPDLAVQHGRFSWFAPAPRGAVYERRELGPGDTVFLRVVHRVQARFDYRAGSAYPATLAGSGKLDAVVADGNGWRRRIPLAPSRQLHDGRLSLSGTLDLKRLWATILRFERESGVHNTAYHLALAPSIRLHGIAAGKPVRVTFAPRLQFDLDELRLQLAHPPGSNTLARSASTSGSRTAPAVIHVGSRLAKVSEVRPLALIVLGAGVALLVATALLLLAVRRGDEIEGIERRYGDLVVDVGTRPRLASDRRVASFPALARIAERYDRLILHESHGDAHSYLVEDAGAVFRYDVGSVDDETLELVPPTPPVRLRSVRR